MSTPSPKPGRTNPWRLWFQNPDSSGSSPNPSGRRTPSLARATVQPTPGNADAAEPNPLATAAEEASVLLDIFSQVSPSIDGRFSEEHKQLVHNAFGRMLNIQKGLRTQDAQNGSVGDWPEGLDELSVNAGCVICFSEVVDTLLMPCRHLVLCGVGLIGRVWEGRTLTLVGVL